MNESLGMEYLIFHLVLFVIMSLVLAICMYPVSVGMFMFSGQEDC